MKLKKLLTLFILTLFTTSGAQTTRLNISKEELNEIANKIYINEAGGKKHNLIVWNNGENFMSLGIGHFIWYKLYEKEGYDESFPKLINFYKQKRIELPDLFKNNENVPWKTRSLFMKSKKEGRLKKVEDFLYDTKDIQILFIFKRLESSLDKMLKITKNKENVKKQFYRVANSKNGLYAMIDYVNFKGEGVSETEKYKGEGWGLLQILEEMKGKNKGEDALTEFRNNAKLLLVKRVENSNPDRNEDKWLVGWLNRCDTYK